MDKFIRFIVTIIGMIIINVLLVVISAALGIILGIIGTVIGMDIQSKLFDIILFIMVLMFVVLPYSLIVTYVLYSGLSKLKTNKYGLLAGSYTQGACCWLFNTITLPYYLISLKFPPKYEETEAPPENYKRNFIIGWVCGLMILLVFKVLMYLLKSAAL